MDVTIVALSDYFTLSRGTLRRF